ncbi:MAG: DNA-binding protein [Magnetococcales bacterium]|nr:DNA-binding protein [Magnetococcales bacterium]MBF0150288.1 DNA-binding protein [Magnetococcales bacterium]MBF0632751.1 DNA-binding protein [Magnetococcales bacterium]
MQPQQYLRTPAAAQFLGLGASTLEKWRLTGTGPKFSRLGRVVVYSLPDLAAFVAISRVSSTSEADQLRSKLATTPPSQPAISGTTSSGKRRGRPPKRLQAAG